MLRPILALELISKARDGVASLKDAGQVAVVFLSTGVGQRVLQVDVFDGRLLSVSNRCELREPASLEFKAN